MKTRMMVHVKMMMIGILMRGKKSDIVGSSDVRDLPVYCLLCNVLFTHSLQIACM